MPAETPAPEDSAPHLARLPAGRHGLPRDFVASNHRGRLLAGCIAAVEEKGYADFTVADVIKQAAVSRRTFYEHFSSKEDCFLAAYDLVIAHVRGLAEETMGSDRDWPHRVKDTFAVALDFIAAEPALARLALLEPVAAGGQIAAHHEATIEDFAGLLHADRPVGSGSVPDESAQRATFVGIVSLLGRRVVSVDAEAVGDLHPVLVEAYLTPYLGLAEAERVARE